MMTLLILSLLGGDDCCKQGEPRPWKAYNAGIRWRAALTQEPDRAAALMGDSLGGRSLADRERLIAERLKSADAWKIALQPALDRARSEGKLVLFFQLVGDLDLEGC